jgi:hypothetical protein
LRGKKEKEKERREKGKSPHKNNSEIETPNGCPLNLIAPIKKFSGHEMCF